MQFEVLLQVVEYDKFLVEANQGVLEVFDFTLEVSAFTDWLFEAHSK